MAVQESNLYTSLPKDVIIIGGSLSGLMHGIMLHRNGSNVRILEQSWTDTPMSHMAGVCLGADVLRFLDRFDYVSKTPLGIPSSLLQSLDREGKVHPFLRATRIMSSWDALYFRLRANFDGLASDYVPCPPTTELNKTQDTTTCSPRARYETSKRVVGVTQLDSGKVQVTYQDISNGGTETKAVTDLVLAADGPNSIIRKMFLEEGEENRQYSGYIAWRGVVPENQVTETAREAFQSNITYSMLDGEGGHVILYNIPGKGGSIEPGERLLNFCWYTNVPVSPTLDNIMTDINGIRHRTSIAPGQIRAEVWEQQRTYARTMFADPYLEVMEKISSPFVHLITDYWSPHTCFSQGKILLVGDASTLLRPHIAFSTNQAAYQTLLTEKLVQGQLSYNEWEFKITKSAYFHWTRSVWFGQFFQQPGYISFLSAIRYWTTSALTKLRVWVGSLPEQSI